MISETRCWVVILDMTEETPVLTDNDARMSEAELSFVAWENCWPLSHICPFSGPQLPLSSKY